MGRVDRRRSSRWVAVVLLLAAALALAGRAAAGSRTVTLTGSGPSPASVTVNRGDKVVFFNNDNVNHTVSDNAGPWAFRATIRPGGSAVTPAFSQAGHYGYTDTWFVALVERDADGAIEVRAPAPSPSRPPTATPKPSPTKPKPSATASPSSSPRATPSAEQSPEGSSTPTPAPSLTLGALPTVTPPPATTGPPPTVATLAPSPTQAVAYGPKSDIAQSSAHRYGLPVLLALMAAAGVLSLLLRFLLAQPSGAGDPGSTDG